MGRVQIYLGETEKCEGASDTRAPQTGGKLLKLLSMSKYHGNVVGEEDKEAQPPSSTRLCWGTLVLKGNHSQQKGQISLSV